jgi:site-specific DNA recombinase
VLRGLLVCDICGRRMQGAYRQARSGGSGGRILYRCELGKSRSVPIDLTDHPTTVYVREDQILPALDRWIEEITDPEALLSLQEADPASTARTAALQAQVSDLNRKIASLVAAIEAGVNIDEVAETLAKRKAEQQAAVARLRTTQEPERLTVNQLHQIIAEVGGIGAALRQATPQERASVYASIGVHARFRPEGRKLIVTADLARVAGRVRGGTLAVSPRHSVDSWIGMLRILGPPQIDAPEPTLRWDARRINLGCLIRRWHNYPEASWLSRSFAQDP